MFAAPENRIQFERAQHAKHERVHYVSAIEDLVIPLPHLFGVEAALSTVMLRRGYAVRNPFNRKWQACGFLLDPGRNERTLGGIPGAVKERSIDDDPPG